MGRLGIGPGSNTGTNIVAATLPSWISPSASWNGTAGSGFTSVPADPTRTTAKPVVQPLIVSNQFFTGELLFGVYAGANNKGSLFRNMGLQCVVFHYEGSTVTVKEPSFQEIIDANDIKRQYFGWWAMLRHDGRNGHAQVYVEAIPLDTTMQRRIIGPFQFSPQPAVHDYTVDVALSQAVLPGSRYQSITAAMTYLRSLSAQNPLIRIIEAGSYDIGSIASTYSGQGYCNIAATAPVTIAKTSYVSESSNVLRSRWDGMHFIGKNIQIDRKFISSIANEARVRLHWLDGARIFNSLGRNSLWRFGTASGGGGCGWYTEAEIQHLPSTMAGAQLARGCTVSDAYWDIVSDAGAIVNCTFRDINNDFFRSDVDCFDLVYSGAETTATLACSGGNDGKPRVFTVAWGANVATLSTDARSDPPLLASNFKAWVEGLSAGFSCTVLDDTRRIAAAGIPGGVGSDFTARNIKGIPLRVVTCFDVHSDWYQQFANAENVVLANNVVTETQTQNLFFTGTPIRDFLVVNNAFHNRTSASQYSPSSSIFSQFNKAHSHVVVAHNSMATQTLLLRTDQTYSADTYCLIANNSLMGLVWRGNPAADVTITNNHFLDGASIPANSTGSAVGGNYRTIYAGASDGDFTPAGNLLLNRKTPVMRYDRMGRSFGTAVIAGAIRG